jgi:hypothetical protein
MCTVNGREIAATQPRAIPHVASKSATKSERKPRRRCTLAGQISNFRLVQTEHLQSRHTGYYLGIVVGECTVREVKFLVHAHKRRTSSIAGVHVVHRQR